MQPELGLRLWLEGLPFYQAGWFVVVCEVGVVQHYPRRQRVGPWKPQRESQCFSEWVVVQWVE